MPGGGRTSSKRVKLSTMMALLRLIWLLAVASCQRLESPDGDCEESFFCRKQSHCPLFLEKKAHLDFLKKGGGGAEYETLLATLKDMVCNKAKRGVCCRESFELVNGNIVESVSMPHPNAVLLTSDSQSFILSVDSSPKSGHFNDILVVPIR